MGHKQQLREEILLEECLKILQCRFLIKNLVSNSLQRLETTLDVHKPTNKNNLLQEVKRPAQMVSEFKPSLLFQNSKEF
jgi:hypothetical protein